MRKVTIMLPSSNVPFDVRFVTHFFDPDVDTAKQTGCWFEAYAVTHGGITSNVIWAEDTGPATKVYLTKDAPHSAKVRHQQAVAVAREFCDGMRMKTD